MPSSRFSQARYSFHSALSINAAFGLSAATAGPGYELAHADGVLNADETVSSRLWRYVLFGTADRGADLPHKAVPAFAKWSDALAPSGLLLSKTDDGWSAKFSTLSAGGGAK